MQISFYRHYEPNGVLERTETHSNRNHPGNDRDDTGYIFSCCLCAMDFMLFTVLRAKKNKSNEAHMNRPTGKWTTLTWGNNTNPWHQGWVCVWERSLRQQFWLTDWLIKAWLDEVCACVHESSFCQKNVYEWVLMLFFFFLACDVHNSMTDAGMWVLVCAAVRKFEGVCVC